MELAFFSSKSSGKLTIFKYINTIYIYIYITEGDTGMASTKHTIIS